MPLRDFAVTAIVFGAIPFIFLRPYVGILVWAWLSYMNPHRLSWGFAYDMPFAQITAIVTMMSLLFDRSPKRFPITPITVLWICFILWVCLTTLTAIHVELAEPALIRSLKIQLVTFLTLLLINDRKKLELLILVIALSIGYFGIKGGVFTLMSGGGARVWGPPGSFIAGNNELALALLMIVPFFVYLFLRSHKRWIRFTIIVAIVLIIFSVIGSQSRGAMLATLCISGFFWLKSPRKMPVLILILLVLPVVYMFMPESWHERMATLQNYEEDGSAMGRIEAWTMSFRLASFRFMGGGFDPWTPYVYSIYGSPDSSGYAAHGLVAHSIYFSVLAEHGWVGFGIFLAIGFLTWRNCTWIIKQSHDHPDLKWADDLARMMQVSLIAFASGGAFLSLAYFDLPWHIMAMTIICRNIVSREKSNHGSHNTEDSHGPFRRTPPIGMGGARS